MDIQSISNDLKLGPDGIWYAGDEDRISYPSDGNDACFQIEENSFWFKHRNECIASIIKSFPPLDGGPVFDIGGGNGFVSLGLKNSGLDVVLVEPGKTGAANAKMRGIENVICATTDTAKLKKDSLPAVGLFDVVEHIQDDLTLLKSINALMKHDGRLYLTVPAYSFLWSSEDTLAGHHRRYNLEQISKLLETAGFKLEYSTYIFRFLPLPILFLRALPYRLGWRRKIKNSNNISRDHATKGGLTLRFLEKLLRSEIDLLDQKKSMHFGGSCLIVATRCKPPLE